MRRRGVSELRIVGLGSFCFGRGLFLLFHLLVELNLLGSVQVRQRRQLEAVRGVLLHKEHQIARLECPGKGDVRGLLVVGLERGEKIRVQMALVDVRIALTRGSIRSIPTDRAGRGWLTGMRNIPGSYIVAI